MLVACAVKNMHIPTNFKTKNSRKNILYPIGICFQESLVCFSWKKNIQKLSEKSKFSQFFRYLLKVALSHFSWCQTKFLRNFILSAIKNLRRSKNTEERFWRNLVWHQLKWDKATFATQWKRKLFDLFFII